MLCAFDLLEVNGEDIRAEPIMRIANVGWLGCCGSRRTASSLTSTSVATVRLSISTLARSAARASCPSGSDRRTAPVGRRIGSRSRTRTRRPCAGSKKKIGLDGRPSLPSAVGHRRAQSKLFRDNNGQALAYVYFETEDGRWTAANLLTRDGGEYRQAAGAGEAAPERIVAMSEKISIQDVDGKPISGHYVVRDGIVIVTASDGCRRWQFGS